MKGMCPRCERNYDLDGTCGCNATGEPLRADVKDTLVCPVEELNGTYPVVLYFGNDADRQEFIALVRSVKPNLVAE